MVNIEEFIKRLEIILDYYSLNASAFADKIGVQRSSLSHLLSGRNKPSLDFILKILDVFPDVDLYWILNGKGSFPKKTTINVDKEVNYPAIEERIGNNLFEEVPTENPIPLQEVKETKQIEYKVPNKDSNEAPIDKIVIFYKDGTFKSYTSK
jgi:transcriptional regulator with XRE-family HTH domain